MARDERSVTCNERYVRVAYYFFGVRDVAPWLLARHHLPAKHAETIHIHSFVKLLALEANVTLDRSMQRTLHCGRGHRLSACEHRRSTHLQKLGRHVAGAAGRLARLDLQTTTGKV